MLKEFLFSAYLVMFINISVRVTNEQEEVWLSPSSSL